MLYSPYAMLYILEEDSGFDLIEALRNNTSTNSFVSIKTISVILCKSNINFGFGLENVLKKLQ